jgi:hypothetical protein
MTTAAAAIATAKRLAGTKRMARCSVSHAMSECVDALNEPDERGG